MTIFFSPDPIGFYDSVLNTDIPNNAVEVSVEKHAELINGQADGKIISIENGQPVLIDRPAPSKDELIAEANLKKTTLLSTATLIINPLSDAIELDIASTEEVATLKAWKVYRVLLTRIDTSTAPDIEWPIQPDA
ncbi:tail fiber assembly protein [Limnobaculum zhutongyuii]|uniref:Tail fiber assembly protein n=1 Tax=Limnobaculum zhutongyuii TaxID=2498113 RepID=A0A411WHV6_9GAMM|nr:tail fiber assembly protein [Limnobaculum zhutongyuii]QBH95782.1 tail fiber assembly protein [Limnobaculum zhutongyuii]QBH96035.1 tail fiber assembly protein [Limnobaculum zhutongyuii]TQS86126.1 tail fiber assembly protein [Limnobaculum zhutongyuii]